jgi:arylformamidase
MLYDISPGISAELAVWPGDTPQTRQVSLDMNKGDTLTLSSIHTTVHLGSHADAPSHYDPQGADIASRALEYYLGNCQLVRLNVQPAALIGVDDIPVAINAERVIFQTGTYPNPQCFQEDFAALSVDLINWLHTQGVITVGIDTPSVDPFSSKSLDAHNAFKRHDMAILEGLVLADVPAGMYELIALPLKLEGFDASPVRAVLRTV